VEVSLSQLEAYLLCPQQYAYQYVYGLRPAPTPFVSLRGALRAASVAVSDRFASGDAPSLDEALAVFRADWSASRANGQQAGAADTPTERIETMDAVYRLHGERVIARLWGELRDGATSAPTSAAPSAVNASDAAPVSVTLAGATITGALDQVEQVEQVEQVDLSRGVTAAGAAQPVTRVMRLQSGKLDGNPTLRDLFYALATEQMRQQGHAAEAVRVSLASGEVKPLRVLAQRRKTLEREVGAALEGLAHANYAPRPVPRTCAVCPFALICPA
jgi:CRISPR/Cas system-associated exonuclease Cas4 (RecB family)